mmetsp:Transcript_20675/g.33677  ORF Transcript_20675/g.33677 Transcript_20675/m.33677 type:complete len:293 (+) Transcript_20675:389-1267(+)
MAEPDKDSDKDSPEVVAGIGAHPLGIENGFIDRTRFADTNQIAKCVIAEEIEMLDTRIARYKGGIWALVCEDGAPQDEIGEWEKTHRCKLPESLHKLLQTANGFSIRWAIPVSGKLRDIGALRINSLQFLACVVGKDLKSIGANAAFVLSSAVHVGSTVLAYMSEADRVTGSAQVWFSDLSGAWHRIAEDFSKYLRLLLVHFGIRGWEYAFTPAGMDPETKQWLRIVSPNRLSIDETRACFEDSQVERGKALSKADIKLGYIDNPPAQVSEKKKKSRKGVGRAASRAAAQGG